MYQPKRFQPGDAPPKRKGGIIRIFGLEGSGKSQLAINSWDIAQPLFYANYDRCASHLLKAYKGEAGFFYEEFGKLDSRADAKSACERLDAFANAAISVGDGVFVIDNENNEWSITKKAYLPNEDAAAKDYDDANEFERNIRLGLEAAGIWTVITTPAKQKWFGARTSTLDGETYYEPYGWAHTKFMATAEVWLYRSPLSPGATITPSGDMADYKYLAEIRTAKYRAAVEGVVLGEEKPVTLRGILEVVKAI